MTNEEILKKAIEKAVRTGWDVVCDYIIDNYKTYYGFIFSHSFAKAFWGEHIHTENLVDSDGTIRMTNFYAEEIPNWQVHLQNMVLASEPLKYIERFL